jgi:hypothetical protein
MLLHILNNGLTLSAVLLNEDSLSKVDKGETDLVNMMIVALLSLPLLYYLINHLNQENHLSQHKIEESDA